ncbi:linear amide C-N hydrolase [Desulfomarina sp.]
MRRKIALKVLLVSAACILPLLGNISVNACTALHVTAKDGGVVVGRTMEFGLDTQSDAVVVPAGTELTSSLPEKAKGIHYTTRYGFVGNNFMGKHMVVDGMNEKGLYVGALYLPGYADYPAGSSEDAAKSMAPEDYVAWLLSNFAEVTEVKKNYNNVILVQNPQKEIGGQSFPGHFLVTDRSGASVVIEPTEKTLKLFDNPLGVLTNSPTFDWHMTNLSNYANLSATNVKPLDLSATTIKTFGQGSGLVGLPGDYTPPSRLVRAVVFSQAAVQLPTAKETVLQVAHIMNAFDIPFGTIREKGKDGSIHYDYTQWTTISDLKNLTFTIKTYKNQTLRRIDVRKALVAAGKEVKVIELDAKQPIEDISLEFKSGW